MNKVIRESLVIVLTGLAINYPLGLFFLWFLMGVLEMESIFWISTLSSLGMTIIAFLRVWWIRSCYARQG